MSLHKNDIPIGFGRVVADADWINGEPPGISIVSGSLLPDGCWLLLDVP